MRKEDPLRESAPSKRKVIAPPASMTGSAWVNTRGVGWFGTGVVVGNGEAEGIGWARVGMSAGWAVINTGSNAFPDGWTGERFDEKKQAVIAQADSNRYKQMGNAVAVPVVDWLIKRLVANT